ncbi:sugar phosphate isomerase/epimerase family protein [Pseudomaricurvus albidus]|uniref:sugar phosphate isomerase/epimerase family protein n=1 Tax=Pseudomaricurvus albidus TaxID=2842452 RepID=UPI001F3E816B|nr:TIM barrel protein [Aestuariicella albida]
MRKTLWPACVRQHSFAEQLAAANRHGFTHLPIGLMTYRQLKSQGVWDDDIRQLASGHNMALGHYDGFSGWAPVKYNPDFPEVAKQVFDACSEECLDICSALGIDRICATGTFAPGQFELSRLADGFARFCESAAARNIQVDLEFLPMWGLPDLATAWSVLKVHRPSNSSILFDTWHFFRGNPDIRLLEALPAGTIQTVQLADAKPVCPDIGLLEECLQYRIEPGFGTLPLSKILPILKRQGIRDVGPEIFSSELDHLSADEAALKVAAACEPSIEWLS